MGLRWTHKEIKKERLIWIRMSNSIVKNSDIAELVAGHGESARQPTKLCDRRRDGFSSNARTDDSASCSFRTHRQYGHRVADTEPGILRLIVSFEQSVPRAPGSHKAGTDRGDVDVVL